MFLTPSKQPHLSVAIVLLLTAVGFNAGCRQKLKVSVPQASWEPIFFRQINAVASLSGQSDLRTTQLPRGDIEVRIWRGFGLSPLEGITLRRSGSQWSGSYVRADHYYEPTKADRRELSHPRSGWDTLWTSLVNERLLSLPDASEINCNVGGLDGIGMVVETNADNMYRTYMCDMPSELKCNEDKNILAIADILFKEFDL